MFGNDFPKSFGSKNGKDVRSAKTVFAWFFLVWNLGGGLFDPMVSKTRLGRRPQDPQFSWVQTYGPTVPQRARGSFRELHKIWCCFPSGLTWVLVVV